MSSASDSSAQRHRQNMGTCCLHQKSNTQSGTEDSAHVLPNCMQEPLRPKAAPPALHAVPPSIVLTLRGTVGSGSYLEQGHASQLNSSKVLTSRQPFMQKISLPASVSEKSQPHLTIWRPADVAKKPCEEQSMAIPRCSPQASWFTLKPTGFLFLLRCLKFPTPVVEGSSPNTAGCITATWPWGP